MENNFITQEEIDKETDLQAELHRALRREEEYWRIKSRKLWLQAGDQNISFFHKQSEARKNFNPIKEIRHMGHSSRNFEDIKHATFSFYKDLFSEDIRDAPDPSSYPLSEVPTLVSEMDNTMLTSPISSLEIRKVLSQMAPDKAPGPDGFPGNFYLACWEIIQKDLLKMVKRSQNCPKLGGSTDSSFLTLIPKEKGAQLFSRFRPISLSNTGYKIITKIIANRLKKVLPKIIPENQGGFVKGRHIQDNIILVQEAIHTSFQRKESGMVVKMDLANAFDRVIHSFLFTVMARFGFHHKLVDWVEACISSPWIAPLVNGRPTQFFKASRGLRQCCPLSSMLYAIQASVLSFQLERALRLRMLSGLNITPGVKNINHAQLADDPLLLGIANTNTTSKFKKELDAYSEASGSEINLRKSRIYGWSCPLDKCWKYPGL